MKIIKLGIALLLIINCIVCLFLFSEIEPSRTMFRVYTSKSLRYENAPKLPLYSSPAWQDYMSRTSFYEEYQGILDDDEYCNKVSKYQKENPAVFDERGLPIKKYRVAFSDYRNGNLVKDVLKRYGNLVLQRHTIEKYSEGPNEYLTPNINLFFEKTPGWHLKHKIGTHFLCDGQMYNHIPGHEHMINKDEAARNAKEYGEYYADRQECFDPWTFMPYTLDLSNEIECKEFMDTLINEEDKSTVKWIKKKSRNSHNAEGVKVVNEKVTEEILQEYGYGDKCGLIEEQFIVQKYVPDPLLIKGRKFDFRIYMLIASVDPLIILYHDGFLRVSVAQYDQSSKESGAHITNTALVKEMLEERNATQAEYEEVMKDQMWTFPQFLSYMQSQGLVEGDWINNYVRPTMRLKMLHLVRMNIERFLWHPRVFELYGVDFMFDSNLHLWFLEVNRSPAMQATTEEKGRIQEKLIKETIDLEYALLYKADFDMILKDTGFIKVFDGRLNGMERYQGLLSEECT